MYVLCFFFIIIINYVVCDVCLLLIYVIIVMYCIVCCRFVYILWLLVGWGSCGVYKSLGGDLFYC